MYVCARVYLCLSPECFARSHCCVCGGSTYAQYVNGFGGKRKDKSQRKHGRAHTYVRETRAVQLECVFAPRTTEIYLINRPSVATAVLRAAPRARWPPPPPAANHCRDLLGNGQRRRSRAIVYKRVGRPMPERTDGASAGRRVSEGRGTRVFSPYSRQPRTRPVGRGRGETVPGTR